MADDLQIGNVTAETRALRNDTLPDATKAATPKMIYVAGAAAVGAAIGWKLGRTAGITKADGTVGADTVNYTYVIGGAAVVGAIAFFALKRERA